MNRIMQVYFGNNCFPYKDKERKVAYPIVAKVGGGSLVCGENNTTKIRFYTTRIGGLSNTWIANLKMPNGRKYNRVLATTGIEEDEFYVDLDISDLYTQIQGEVIIGLNGFEGEMSITEEDDQYIINGTPNIVSTYVIKVMVNYAPLFLPIGDIEPDIVQQILALIATKLNITNGIVVMSEDTDLTQFENGQVLLDKETGKLYKYNGTTLVEFELDLLNFAKTNKANVFTENQKIKGASLSFEEGEEPAFPSGTIEYDNENQRFDIEGYVDLYLRALLGSVLIQSGEDGNVEIQSGDNGDTIIDGTTIPKNTELQEKLIAGQNITINGNVISATCGGGGADIEAGYGISIATGEMSKKIVGVDTSVVATTSYAGSLVETERLRAVAQEQNIREVAEGKCKVFILQYGETDPKSYAEDTFPEDTYQKIDGTPIDTKEEFEEYVGDLELNNLANTRFNSQNADVEIADTNFYYVFTLIGYQPENAKKYIVNSADLEEIVKAGDIILVVETDVPDRWFAGLATGYHFYKLETSKVDLTNCAKTNTTNTFTADQTFNGIVKVLQKLDISKLSNYELAISNGNGYYMAFIVGGSERVSISDNTLALLGNMHLSIKNKNIYDSSFGSTTTDSSSTTYSGTLTSNQEKVFTQPLTSLTITGLTQASGDDLPRYECSFVVGANMTITLPSGVVWKMGTPTLTAGDSWTLYIKGGFAYLC